MKDKKLQKLLRKNNSNSGFTLTELLVGLIMSTFVIGALGFGLMQVLRLTQKGNSETAARNESSRALEFISDEMRRAQNIEVDMSDGNINKVATDYSKPSGGTVRLALQIPGVDQRIIYSVADPETVDSNSPWKGPLAIYRWGPDFNAAGDYSNPNDPGVWQNDVLADGISDVDQSVACDNNGDGAAENISYKGFFACVIDDDGDTITEDVTDQNGDGVITFADDPNDQNKDGKINFADSLKDENGDGNITFADSAFDTNGDGAINAADGADTDGFAITAQLYFTGKTEDGSGLNTSTYSADSKTVTRARTLPDNNANASGSYFSSYTPFDPSFACNADVEWIMRTDFGDGFNNPSNLSKQDYQTDIQPQPVAVDGDTLVISSVPRGVGGATCLNSRANNGREEDQSIPRDFSGNTTLAEDEDWYGDSTKDSVVAVSHTINFNDPRTFNGDPISCTGYPCASSNEGKVYTQQDNAPAEVNPYVLVLKEGTQLPALNGYDINNDGDLDDQGEQISLGEFLYNEGYATLNGSVYEINGLDKDQRIIAFEVGKSDVADKNAPGVDFQDNIFILQADAFAQRYRTYEDNYNNSDQYNPPSYSVLN